MDLRRPDPRVFSTELVARSLANLPRYAGNYSRDYSVAQHEVLASMVVERLGGNPLQQLAALHHDDIEVLSNDISKPWKTLVPENEGWERRWMKALEEKYSIFGMLTDDHEMVSFADKQVFVNEVLKLIPPECRGLYAPLPPVRIILPWMMMMPWGPDMAFARYMDRHVELERECSMLWASAAKGEGGGRA